MSRCRALLQALHTLPPDEWRRRASALPSSETRAALRAELERRCDAFELWVLRDDVATLCWRLPEAERARLRELIADAALALMAGVTPDDDGAGPLIAPFADLIVHEQRLPPAAPRARALASSARVG